MKKLFEDERIWNSPSCTIKASQLGVIALTSVINFPLLLKIVFVAVVVVINVSANTYVNGG